MIVDFHGTPLFSAAGTLWRTDGTAGGTWPIGPALFAPRFFAVADTVMYFGAP
ncbi:MAG TPA: hypothetical protein VGQ83_37075 [Polyangia bacterium]|jgi:hypothetical protein